MVLSFCKILKLLSVLSRVFFFICINIKHDKVTEYLILFSYVKVNIFIKYQVVLIYFLEEKYAAVKHNEKLVCPEISIRILKHTNNLN